MTGKAVNRLFVYGTLAPGQANEHFLREIGGCWQPGAVRGLLYPQGIGLTSGYPALQLNAEAPAVPGMLFSSSRLAELWAELDAFEGEGYRRTLVTVLVRGGARLPAWVYALDEELLPSGSSGTDPRQD